MSVGSGRSEDQYRREKNARDKLERSLIDHGVRPDKARDTANKIANETTNRRREEGK